MLKIWGSILMVTSLFVMAGVPTDNFAIMCLLLLIGIVGFAQGFIMLRMEK
jgi:predicted exporter